MNPKHQQCPECGQTALYFTEVIANGGRGPILLPGLSRSIFWSKQPKFRVVVCSICGLTRFYAERSALEILRSNDSQEHWQKV